MGLPVCAILLAGLMLTVEPVQGGIEPKKTLIQDLLALRVYKTDVTCDVSHLKERSDCTAVPDGSGKVPFNTTCLTESGSAHCVSGYWFMQGLSFEQVDPRLRRMKRNALLSSLMANQNEPTALVDSLATSAGSSSDTGASPPTFTSCPEETIELTTDDDSAVFDQVLPAADLATTTVSTSGDALATGDSLPGYAAGNDADYHAVYTATDTATGLNNTCPVSVKVKVQQCHKPANVTVTSCTDAFKAGSSCTVSCTYGKRLSSGSTDTAYECDATTLQWQPELPNCDEITDGCPAFMTCPATAQGGTCVLACDSITDAQTEAVPEDPTRKKRQSGSDSVAPGIYKCGGDSSWVLVTSHECPVPDSCNPFQETVDTIETNSSISTSCSSDGTVCSATCPTDSTKVNQFYCRGETWYPPPTPQTICRDTSSCQKPDNPRNGEYTCSSSDTALTCTLQCATGTTPYSHQPESGTCQLDTGDWDQNLRDTPGCAVEGNPVVRLVIGFTYLTSNCSDGEIFGFLDGLDQPIPDCDSSVHPNTAWFNREFEPDGFTCSVEVHSLQIDVSSCDNFEALTSFVEALLNAETPTDDSDGTQWTNMHHLSFSLMPLYTCPDETFCFDGYQCVRNPGMRRGEFSQCQPCGPLQYKDGSDCSNCPAGTDYVAPYPAYNVAHCLTHSIPALDCIGEPTDAFPDLSFTCDEPAGTHFSDGDRCGIVCPSGTGNTMESPPDVVCDNGAWEIEGGIPASDICAALDCIGEPTDAFPDLSFTCDEPAGTHFSDGDRCGIVCPSGTGNTMESPPDVVCDNGAWEIEGGIPASDICAVQGCSDPLDTFGNDIMHSCVPTDGLYTYHQGSTCDIQCLSSVSAATHVNYTLTCDGGQWVLPGDTSSTTLADICGAQNCSDPSHIFGPNVNVSCPSGTVGDDGYGEGSQCEIICPMAEDGTQNIDLATCSYGHWTLASGADPANVCAAQGCPHPSAEFDDPNLAVDCGDPSAAGYMYEYGSECNVTCLADGSASQQTPYRVVCMGNWWEMTDGDGNTINNLEDVCAGDDNEQGHCRPGFMSSTGQEPCQRCPNDTYSDVSGSRECLECPSGSVTLATGSSNCVQEFDVLLSSNDVLELEGLFTEDQFSFSAWIENPWGSGSFSISIDILRFEIDFGNAVWRLSNYEGTEGTTEEPLIIDEFESLGWSRFQIVHNSDGTSFSVNNGGQLQSNAELQVNSMVQIAYDDGQTADPCPECPVSSKRRKRDSEEPGQSQTVRISSFYFGENMEKMSPSPCNRTYLSDRNNFHSDSFRTSSSVYFTPMTCPTLNPATGCNSDSRVIRQILANDQTTVVPDWVPPTGVQGYPLYSDQPDLTVAHSAGAYSFGFGYPPPDGSGEGETCYYLLAIYEPGCHDPSAQFNDSRVTLEQCSGWVGDDELEDGGWCEFTCSSAAGTESEQPHHFLNCDNGDWKIYDTFSSPVDVCEGTNQGTCSMPNDDSATFSNCTETQGEMAFIDTMTCDVSCSDGFTPAMPQVYCYGGMWSHEEAVDPPQLCQGTNQGTCSMPNHEFATFSNCTETQGEMAFIDTMTCDVSCSDGFTPAMPQVYCYGGMWSHEEAVDLPQLCQGTNQGTCSMPNHEFATFSNCTETQGEMAFIDTMTCDVSCSDGFTPAMPQVYCYGGMWSHEEAVDPPQLCQETCSDPRLLFGVSGGNTDLDFDCDEHLTYCSVECVTGYPEPPYITCNMTNHSWEPEGIPFCDMPNKRRKRAANCLSLPVDPANGAWHCELDTCILTCDQDYAHSVDQPGVFNCIDESLPATECHETTPAVQVYNVFAYGILQSDQCHEVERTNELQDALDLLACPELMDCTWTVESVHCNETDSTGTGQLSLTAHFNLLVASSSSLTAADVVQGWASEAVDGLIGDVVINIAQDTTYVVSAELMCPDGQYIESNGMCHPVPCESGMVFSVEASGCEPCPTGTFYREGSCVPCPTDGTAGEDPAGEDQSYGEACLNQDCEPGTWSYNGKKPCTACGEDSYQDQSGMTQCVDCPFYQSTLGVEGAESCSHTDLILRLVSFGIDSVPQGSLSVWLMYDGNCLALRLEMLQFVITVEVPQDGDPRCTAGTTDASEEVETSTCVVPSHVWTHLAFVADSNDGLHIFINGVETLQRATPSPDTTSASQLRFIDDGTCDKHTITVSGVLLLDRPMTETERQGLLAGPTCIPGDSQLASANRFVGMTPVDSDYAMVPRSCAVPVPEDYCANTNCANGGSCIIDAATNIPSCSCRSGFTGPTCAEEYPLGEWTPWEAASDCSATCGSGIRTMKRSCKAGTSFVDTCEGASSEQVTCQDEPCRACLPFENEDELDCDENRNCNCKSGTTPTQPNLGQFSCSRDTGYRNKPNSKGPYCGKQKIPKKVKSEVACRSLVQFQCLLAAILEFALQLLSGMTSLTCRSTATQFPCSVKVNFPTCGMIYDDETGTIATTSSRRRRATQTADDYSLQFTMPLADTSDVDIQAFYDSNTVTPALQEVVQAIADLQLTTADLTANPGTYLNVTVNGVSYSVDPASVVEQSSVECTSGSTVENGECVECPAGTAYDSGSLLCVLCDVGYYQSQTAQTTCVQCAQGTTTAAIGSTSASDCVSDSSASVGDSGSSSGSGSSDEDSSNTTTIVVATVVPIVTLGLLGVAGFFGWKYYQRHHLRTKKFGSSNRIQPASARSLNSVVIKGDESLNTHFQGFRHPSPNPRFEGVQKLSPNTDVEGFRHPSPNVDFEKLRKPSPSTDFEGFRKPSPMLSLTTLEPPDRELLYASKE